MADSHDLLAKARALFRMRFGCSADIAVIAPGRVNLIGEHMDYNGGPVLPMAIHQSIVLVARQRATDTNELRAFSADLDEEICVDYSTTDTVRESGWAAYVTGVVALCQKLGMHPPGMDVILVSDLPRGAGLSSSAALEVAFATLLENVCDAPLEPWQKIRLCQQAENEYAGMPCGFMDQAAIVLAREAHLLLLDCASRETLQVPFVEPSISVLIIDSRVKHQLTDSPFARRRRQCEDVAAVLGQPPRALSMHELDARREELDAVGFRRARHVVSEVERTFRAVDAVVARDWNLAGELMYASHASLRDDYEVSCIEVDALVDACATLGAQAGVYGSRITGGGFGGCVVALIESARLAEIKSAVADAYRAASGIEARFIHATPAPGVRVIDDRQGG